MNISSLTSADQANARAELARGEGMANAFEKNLTIAAQSGDDLALLQACQDFESYFIQEMFKNMRSSAELLSKGGVFRKSEAERIFTEMRDEEFAKSASRSGGIGLTAFLYKQLQRENAARMERAVAAEDIQ